MSKPSIVENESKVTKSPSIAPWSASVTVTVVVPFVVNGFVKAAVSLIGVMSYKALPEYKYSFLSVPKARYLVPSKPIQLCVSRTTPTIVLFGSGK